MGLIFNRAAKNPLDIDKYTDVIVYPSECKCGKDDYLFHFEDTPVKNVTTYTTGKTFRWHGYDRDLILVTSSPLGHIKLSQYLQNVADYFIDDFPSDFNPGGVTRNLGAVHKSSPELVAFYIMHSNSFKSKEVAKEFMQVVPVSVKELKFIEIHGGEALEKHFTKHKVDIFDFHRSCSLQGVHLTYSDIPDPEGSEDDDRCFVIDLPEYGEVVIDTKSDAPQDGLMTYNCDDFTTINPVAFHKNALLIASNDDNHANVPQLFLSFCNFFWSNPECFTPGYATPAIGPIDEGSVLTSVYISHVHWFGSVKLNSLYLMMTPISDAELAYLNEHGAEKFEAHLFSGNVNVFDFTRNSSI